MFRRFGRPPCERLATLAAVLLSALTAAPGPMIAAEEKTPATFTIPDGTPTELLAYIVEVKSRKPANEDRAVVGAHLVAVQNAVIAAAEKIVAGSPNQQERTSAVTEKLTALMLLRRLDAPDAEARLKKYLDELAKDPHPFIPPLGEIHSLATRLQQLDRGNHAEIEKLVGDVRRHVRSAKLDVRNLSLAFQTALAAEQAGLTKLASEAYLEFADIFSKSDNPAVAENAKKLEGSARLLALPGKPLEIDGKLLDGKKLDWKSYRGKTVLVVFWATWCGPCIAELPTIKDAYSKYKDRKFAVVTISLDEDRRRLEDFVKREIDEFTKKEEVEWPVVVGDDLGQGWNHPLAKHYGVMGLPRTVLVDAQGNVITIDAHGEVLWELLAKQIGPAVVKETKDAVPAEDGKLKIEGAKLPAEQPRPEPKKE